MTIGEWHIYWGWGRPAVWGLELYQHGFALDLGYLYVYANKPRMRLA